MKRAFFLICAGILMTSCASTFHFLQVAETQCINRSTSITEDNPYWIYADENCDVYYRIDPTNGFITFIVENKTDRIMYIDMQKSFFSLNGISNTYYKGRSWSSSNTSSLQVGTMSTSTNATVSSSTNYVGSIFGSGTANGNAYSTTANNSAFATGNINSDYANFYSLYKTSHASYNENAYSMAASLINSNTSSVSWSEMPIRAIAPKTCIVIGGEYSLALVRFKDCDLERYPEQKASMQFNNHNTPMAYSNVFTYNFGEGSQDKTIQCDFQVTKVTNYAQPTALEYRERLNKKNICKNMQEGFVEEEMSSSGYISPKKVFDIYYTFNPTNCILIPYDITTSKILYKRGKTYYWNGYYEGWCLSE